METLSNKILNYSDINYNKAVNYQYMYNYPITLNFGPKHERKKYIIGAGTSDSISILKEGIFIYVISENRGLNYIGMDVINTETNELEQKVFLSDSDLQDEEAPTFGVLDLPCEEQFKILCQYLD